MRCHNALLQRWDDLPLSRGLFLEPIIPEKGFCSHVRGPGPGTHNRSSPEHSAALPAVTESVNRTAPELHSSNYQFSALHLSTVFPICRSASGAADCARVALPRPRVACLRGCCRLWGVVVPSFTAHVRQ